MHLWKKVRKESWGLDNSKTPLIFLIQVQKDWDIKDLVLRKFLKFPNIFHSVFVCFLNWVVVKDESCWYYWIPHWILCRKKYNNIFLAEQITRLWAFSWEPETHNHPKRDLTPSWLLLISLGERFIAWLFFSIICIF